MVKLATLVVGAGIVVGTLIGIGSCANSYILSEGVRVGQVNKFSKRGMIFKSYEGTLALQGLSTQGANL